MNTGLWVKYRLYFDTHLLFMYKDKWEYEYIESFYPFDGPVSFDRKVKLFKEYICANVYTCELVVVDSKDVPDEVRARKIEYYKDKMQNASMDIIKYQKEIEFLSIKGQHCPNCPDQGWYAIQNRNGDPEQEQCEFCYTVEDSVFNINNKVL